MSASAAIAKGVRTLWKEGHLEDFTIHVEDQCFTVHKLIMCSVSDYFRAMLTGNMMESKADSVHLEGMNAEVMESLINFIYTDKMKITILNATDILSGAMYLQIASAVDECVYFLLKNLDAKNCFDVLSVFEEYFLVTGEKDVKDFIEEHIREVIKEIGTSHVRYKDLFHLISIWPDSEMQLFQLVKKWVEDEPENRKNNLNKLLSTVRFCLMTPQELEDIKTMNIFTSVGGPWHELIDRALQYHQLPIHKKVLDCTEQSKVRSPMAPSIFSSDDGHICIYTLDGEERKWRTHPLADMPHDCRDAETVIEVNNFLVVKASSLFLGAWYIFDPRQLSWSQIADMGMNREGVASVYHAGYLYAIGGIPLHGDDISDVIEKYDFQTDSWTPFVSLPRPLIEHDACMFKDSIFVTGGKYHGQPLSDVHCLNLVTEQWEKKAPMLQVRKFHKTCVMTIHGEEVLCCFTKDFAFDYYSMETNQWSTFNFEYMYSLPSPSRYDILTCGNTITFTDRHMNNEWDNDGDCFQVVYPQNHDRVSVDYLNHFIHQRQLDRDQDDPPSYSAMLSVPLYKLSLV